MPLRHPLTSHPRVKVGWTLLLLILTACTPRIAKEHTDALPPIFPDYQGVTIPRQIAPLNFGIEDAQHLEVTLTAAGTQAVLHLSGTNSTDIDVDDWHQLTQQADSLVVSVSLWNQQHPEGLRYKDFTIHLSSDPIDPYIAYRLIPPGYELWHRMGIYQRSLTTFEETPIVTNDHNHHGCVNCHSFCNYSPQHLMFHARGKNGGTVILDASGLHKEALEALPPGKKGTYPMWHPQGRWIAFSSNNTKQSFYHLSQDKIEVYDLESDLMIYDTQHKRVLTDPRFTTPQHWETFPAFSPDGHWLYFCQAQATVMPIEKDKLHYKLLRVPFDSKTGTLGEPVDTLYSQGSVSFPRLSPDGRYLMFTKADCATFPIWHKEADNLMLRLSDRQLLDTHILNSPDTDSYHAWSSSGRWVLFSSRRIDGRYTRLYIAHCDPQGRFTKPFLLPQSTPWHNHLRMDSYNIPEFIAGKVHLHKVETLFQE